MSSLAGIAHITLSVRNRDTSVEFYRDVLGFHEYKTEDGPHWRRTFCRHPNGLVLCLTQHTDHFNARFDPRHAGMDHLAFAVSSPTTSKSGRSGWTRSKWSTPRSSTATTGRC